MDLSSAKTPSTQHETVQNNADIPYVHVPKEVKTMELEYLGYTVSQKSVIVSYSK